MKMWTNAVGTTSEPCERLNTTLSSILIGKEEECRMGLHLWNVRSLQNLVLLAFIKRNYKPLIILAICGALAFLRPNADETTGLLNLGLRVRVPKIYWKSRV